MKVMRLVAIAAGLIIVWQVTVLLTGAPPYILPGPLRVAKQLLLIRGLYLTMR